MILLMLSPFGKPLVYMEALLYIWEFCLHKRRGGFKNEMATINVFTLFHYVEFSTNFEFKNMLKIFYIH